MFTSGPGFFGTNGGTTHFISPFYPTILFSMCLRSATYAGACCRVRRSNDNAEADIGFDPTTGYISDSQLLAHVGVFSGFVTRWYDQGSNARNALQATTASQPRLVNSGTIEKIGGITMPRFDGSAWRLVVANNTDLDAGTNDNAIEMLVETAINSQNRFYDRRPGGSGSQDILFLVGGTVNYFVSGGNNGLSASGMSVGTLANAAACRSGSANRIFIGGAQSTPTVTNAQNLNGSELSIGNDGVASTNLGVDGHIFEVRYTNGSPVQTANYIPWGTA